MDNCNWERYKSSYQDLREEQISQIDKMLSCLDPSRGFFLYDCDDCNLTFTRKHRCNSRACSRCGTYYVNKWAEKTCKKLFKVAHSHIIFTMPSSLWTAIKDNFDCIKALSTACHETISEIYTESSKQVILPGMIQSLHTFEEDMKYNVHFHNIVTNGGMSVKYNVWKHIDYIPYRLLHRKWKHKCLDVVTKHLPMTMENQCLLGNLRYYQYLGGFNVHVVKTDIPRKELVRYIARYIRHPPISNRRIVDYNGQEVTIVCGKKEKSYVTFTIEEFISRIVQHIPIKSYKMVRNFGLYSSKKYNKVPVKKDIQVTITKYCYSKNAIPCPQCGKILNPIEYFPPSLPEGPPQQEVLDQKLTHWTGLS
jgi:hypothetical protein